MGGYMEGFHDNLRDERLNRELFGDLLEARIILKSAGIRPWTNSN
jgi:hypothetical protein